MNLNKSLKKDKKFKKHSKAFKFTHIFLLKTKNVAHKILIEIFNAQTLDKQQNTSRENKTDKKTLTNNVKEKAF